MSEPTTMRRIPKQARSQQRVNHMLDTAEQLFVEIGYEHTTTNAIAARARVPIGSLYQFFPSKEAIFEALIERYTGEMNALLHNTLGGDIPLLAVIGSLVDGLAAYDSTHAGLKMMLMATDIAYNMHYGIVQFVDESLRRRYPNLNHERCRQSATIMVAIVKALMPLSGPPNHLPADQVLIEVKMALVAYLEAILRSEGISP